jgi:hypothetical protein
VLAPRELLSYRPSLVPRLQAESSRVYAFPVGSAAIQRAVVRGPEGWQAEPRFALGTLELLLPAHGARWRLRGSFDGDFTGMSPRLLGPLGERVLRHRTQPLGVTLLRLANVTHVVSLESAPFGGQLVPTAEVESVFASPVRLFRVPAPVPSAYLVGSVHPVEPALALDVLGEPGFDPESVALVAPGTQLGLPQRPVRGQVELVTRTSAFLELRIRSDAPALLVVVEARRAGWSARVDGRAVDTVAANLLFIGVPVPAGQHTVELSYFPPGLIPGVALAGLALLAACWMLCRRDPVEAPRSAG